MSLFLLPYKVILLDTEFWFQFFSFSTLWMLFYFLLFSIVSNKNSNYYLSINNKSFSSGHFQVFLWLAFKFANDVSGHRFLWVCPAEVCWTPWVCRLMPLTKFGNFLGIVSSNTFSTLHFYLSWWDSDDINARSFVNISQVCEVLFLKKIFLLSHSLWVNSNDLSSNLLILSSAIFLLMLGPFLFFIFVFFNSKITLCFFFISLTYLLRLFSFLYLRVFAFSFWNIFIIAAFTIR